MDNGSLFYYSIERTSRIIYVFSNLYQLDKINSHVILAANLLKTLLYLHQTKFLGKLITKCCKVL
jgi:hypothetical protein